MSKRKTESVTILPIHRLAAPRFSDAQLEELATRAFEMGSYTTQRFSDSLRLSTASQVFDVNLKKGSMWVADTSLLWNPDIEPKLIGPGEPESVVHSYLEKHALLPASKGDMTVKVEPISNAGTSVATYDSSSKRRQDRQLDVQIQALSHRLSRRNLLLAGVAALGLGGVAMAWRGCAQPSIYTSFEPTRASLPVARLKTGQTVSTYRGHASAVFSVGWSPDGTSLASASTDHTVQVWGVRSGRQDVTYRGHTSPVLTVAWSPDGMRLVSGSGETGGEAAGDTSVQVWDARSGGHVLTYGGHSQPVLSVAWSPDGTSIASGGEDSMIQVWDAATGRMQPSFVDKTYPGIITSLAWSPDGTALALATDQRSVHICEASTGNWKRTYAGHTSIVNAVVWSPDGASIASGGFDRTAQVWHATTGASTVTYTGHTSFVNAVAWSPDGTALASGSTDATVQVWQVM